MMEYLDKKTIKLTINSIDGGKSNYFDDNSDNKFFTSLGIDTNLPRYSSGIGKISRCIYPMDFAKFSGNEVNSSPMWIITNPKNTNIYAYLKNGKFISYTSALASETLVDTVSTSTGNGGAYYNNYIYLASNTDIYRYGPLSSSPALSASFWQTTLSKTALGNQTYINSLPNHPMHVHTNNCLYFGDFVNGKGYISYIKTKKTTAEGDTNDGSLEYALDLPFGYMPTDIESYGTDLIISAIQTTDTVTNQGQSALFFWDTLSPTFYRQVPVPFAVCSALLNKNGELSLFSSDTSYGMKELVYLGGFSFEEVSYLPNSKCPNAGAVDSIGLRTIFAGNAYDLNNAIPTVVGRGYTDSTQEIKAINCISYDSGSSATKITSLKNVRQETSPLSARYIFGWENGTSAYGISSQAATVSGNVLQTPFYPMPKKFKINKIKINIPGGVFTNTKITPSILLDDFYTSQVNLAQINNTNYAGKKKIIYKSPELDAGGEYNFSLRFTYGTSSSYDVINLPIEVEIILLDDQTA